MSFPARARNMQLCPVVMLVNIPFLWTPANE